MEHLPHFDILIIINELFFKAFKLKHNVFTKAV